MSKLTDNNMQAIKVIVLGDTATVVSDEVDLELPRGFIAKIHFLDFWVENFEAVAIALANQRSNWALVRDPDDAATTEMPEGRVQHDVIAEFQATMAIEAVDDVIVWNGLEKQIRFDQSEELDVISFRNLRFNGVGENATGIDFIGNLIIYYTLEEVKDDEILELLDIL